MNPIGLLTTGRTFKDMAERPGAYKLLANTPVPKFAGKKKFHVEEHSVVKVTTALVKTPAPMAQVAPELPPVPSATPVLPAPAPVPIEASVAAIPMETAAVTVPPTLEARPASIPISSRVKRTAGEWIHRFVYGRTGPNPQRTVQTELALEKVTVLKNDLNEADLEVVLVEKKAGSGEKSVARLSRVEMTGEAWTRLTAPFRKKTISGAAEPKKLEPALNARA